MNVSGESLREAGSRIGGPLTPKKTLRMGLWNVRTMYQIGKLAEVERVMEKTRCDLLGVCESRWKENGKLITGRGNMVLYSGGTEAHERGVALIIQKRWRNSLIEWSAIDDRLLFARFDSRHIRLSVIVGYAPTEADEAERKEEFYEKLEGLLQRCKEHDLKLIIGDMNAKVGSDNGGMETVMGKHGCGTINENGRMMTEMCLRNDMVIGGTLFPHKEIHKRTWKSPDGRTFNQIDHIMIDRKWRRSLMDVRVMRGADVRSDHFLVIGKIKLKLNTRRILAGNKILDMNKLKDEEVKVKFNLELRNRFEILKGLQEEGNEEDESIDIQRDWDGLVDAYMKTGEEYLKKGRKRRRPWISDETLKLVEERERIHGRILNLKSERLKQIHEEKYRTKAVEVKRSARKDKNDFFEEIARSAEEAAGRGEMSRVYEITRRIKNNGRKSCMNICDKQGKIILGKEEVKERWKEHFEEVLNREDLGETLSDMELGEDMATMDVCTDAPTIEEIETAIRALKNGKAPGVDGVKSEMLKESIGMSAEMLERIFKQIWDKERLPEDWRTGKMVLIPKKGDVRNCNNWRGITLLSVPGKVFTKVIMNRIKDEIDKRLRKEQAGFRTGRSCIDQIFTLRNIIEQCCEQRRSVYLNFIDFEKAFDSLNQLSLWKILEKYGIPKKLVDIIRLFYREYECTVEVERERTEMFRVSSGVRQGCNMSATLFNIALDWVMRKTTEGRGRGIRWGMMDHLEDLDFADDICLMSYGHRDAEEKMERVAGFGGRIGLRINRQKTKTMAVNSDRNIGMNLGGEELERVEKFQYLGSLVTNKGGSSEDINSRIRKGEISFRQLNDLWRSRGLNRRTKIRIYKSNVRSVLMYGCETWSPSLEELRKLNVFQNKCLRRILGVTWMDRVSNEELYRRTEVENMENLIRMRRLKYFGHLWRSDNDIGKMAVNWTPGGVRGKGRPSGTWRRTMEGDLKRMGCSWGEVKRMAKDREAWKKSVEALCSARTRGS